MVCSKRPGINENTNPEMTTVRYAASLNNTMVCRPMEVAGCHVTRRGCDSLRGRFV
jgi:hypothetical protein